MEFDNSSDVASVITLELSTESIRTLEQAPAYPWQNFLTGVGGNMAIFFGFSLTSVSLLQFESYEFK